MAYLDTLHAVLDELDVFLGSKASLRDTINGLIQTVPGYPEVLDDAGLSFPITGERLKVYHKYLDQMNADMTLDVMTSTIPYYGGNIDVRLRRKGIKDFAESDENPTGGEWTREEDHSLTRTYTVGRNEGNRASKRSIIIGFTGKDLFGTARDVSGAVLQSAMPSLTLALSETSKDCDWQMQDVQVSYTRNDQNLGEARKYGPPAGAVLIAGSVVKPTGAEDIMLDEGALVIALRSNLTYTPREGNVQFSYTGYNGIQKLLSLKLSQAGRNGIFIRNLDVTQVWGVGYIIEDDWQTTGVDLPVEHRQVHLPVTSDGYRFVHEGALYAYQNHIEHFTFVVMTESGELDKEVWLDDFINIIQEKPWVIDMQQ
ncbi:MAG: hypothetical protein MJY83_04965 [Bacteroidales bacterium]|nr:hypothetical protein [Bacteroidales bacterium]